MSSSFYKPCEKASDLLKRLRNIKPFEFKTDGIHPPENISFNDFVEIQAIVSDIPELVLDVMCQFSQQFENGRVIHISTGNRLENYLHQSHTPVLTLPLAPLLSACHIKTLRVQSILQLLSLSELLKLTLDEEEPTLILVDGLNSLLLSQRSLTGSLPSTSLLHSTLTSLQNLCQCKSAIILWLAAAVPKLSGGVREGHIKDPVTALWKQRVPRFITYRGCT